MYKGQTNNSDSSEAEKKIIRRALLCSAEHDRPSHTTPPIAV